MSGRPKELRGIRRPTMADVGRLAGVSATTVSFVINATSDEVIRPETQRRVLDEVLSRHDQTGTAFAVAAITAAGRGTDPLKAVMQADRAWQDAQRRRAEVVERSNGSPDLVR